MVVSSRAKFVTPGSVSFVTFWAPAMPPPTPATRTKTSAYRFSMMGAMVGQPSHDAPHAARACPARFDGMQPSGCGASTCFADQDDRSTHRRLDEHEGRMGVPAQPARGQDAR